MAPEVIIRKGHNRSADWWSLGVVLYDMLNGGPPFTGKDRQEAKKAVCRGKLKLKRFDLIFLWLRKMTIYIQLFYIQCSWIDESTFEQATKC